jgi:hypothetical protein
MIKIQPYHTEAAVIGMWRMGAIIEQIIVALGITSYHAEKIIKNYAATH